MSRHPPRSTLSPYATPSRSGTGPFTKKAGTFTFTVTDKNGCTADTTITIPEPPLLTASSRTTPLLCNRQNTTYTVFSFNGTAPHTRTGDFSQKACTFTLTVT